MKRFWVLCVASIALAACNPQPQHAAQGSSPTPTASGMPAIVISGHGTSNRPATFTRQSGNRKVYQLVANSYTSRSAANIAQASFAQPTVTFYDKDGTKLTAQAPTASLRGGGKQVVLSGGVHARTSTGLNMTCDRLTYDQNTGLLHGEGNVRITGVQGGQQQMLTGNSFTSDVKLTQMVMK